MWQQLKKKFDSYVLGKNLPVDDHNIKGLVTYIIGEASTSDLEHIVSDLYGLPSI